MSPADESQNTRGGESDETITATAARLLARRRNSERWSAGDEEELQAWLKADPRHRREFEILDTIYDMSGGVPGASASARRAGSQLYRGRFGGRSAANPDRALRRLAGGAAYLRQPPPWRSGPRSGPLCR
ncbi:MAG: FecR/PupR family sigma factor regulator [Opitutales bacterium]